jgi:hypothetical protein
MEFQGDSDRQCNCLAGGIINGWSKPAGRDYDLAAVEAFKNNLGNSVGIITNDRGSVQVNPIIAQQAGKVACIRVLYLSQEQLGSDGNDFRSGHITSDNIILSGLSKGLGMIQ